MGRACENQLGRAGDAGQEGQDSAPILVPHHPDHQDEPSDGRLATPGPQGSQILSQRLGGVRIVRPIEPDVRPSSHQFQPPGPAHRAQSVPPRALGDAYPELGGHLQGGQRARGVVQLMAPRKRARQPLFTPPQPAIGKTFRPLASRVKVLAEHDASGLSLRRHCTDHGQGPLAHPAHDDGRPVLDDPGLLERDGFQRAPQVLLVVKPDRGDERDQRGDHVGRIEAPPQTDFHHRMLDPHLGEVGERHDGRRLEERRRFRQMGLGGHPHAFSQLCEPLGRDGATIDLNALREIHEMGGGVEADAIALARQHGGQHGGRGSLAVGPAHMNRGEHALRVAQRAQQRQGTAEARLDPVTLESVQEGDAALDASIHTASAKD